ncbi:MAG: BMP family ABC transporter substrate-binding protein [Anaerolineae bacterium]|nr:BMP family ABC transporter substrate-binding protein [Anaerolineae bacterium]
MRKNILFVLVLVLLVGVFMPAAAQDEFVFGVILVGPQNDRGWSQSHFEAAEYVEANFPGATKLVFESLNPADAPETTLLDVVTEMVDSGAQLIFTTSDSFEEETNTVAEAFPEVTFVNITGSNVLNGAPENVGNFNGLMEVPRLIAGCAAGMTTQTGKIGYLGALINDETRRLADSAYLGAKYCYETFAGGEADTLEFDVTWIGFWFNIPGVTLDPTEVANEFFNSGADVIISCIDTTEAIVVAGQRQSEGETVYAIPYGNANGCSEAPDACLGVAYYNWGPAYLDTVQSVVDGTWEQDWVWIEPYWDEVSAEGYYTGADTSVIGYLHGDGASEEVRATLDTFVEEIAAYEATDDEADGIYLWSGPLALQDGTVLAEEGEPVALLDVWHMGQLLEGMTGASE